MSSQLHTESGQDKITFRLPTHLKEQFKEQSDNMSEELEAFVRQKVNEPANDDEIQPFEDPDDRDLRLAYKALRRNMSKTGRVPAEKARKALAGSVPHTSKDDAYRHLKRLENRAYVKLQEHPDGRGLACVNVRPFSKRQR